jgi:hypothetical protein
MSNLLIAVSERLGSQAPVFKPSHAHIIMYKPFGITRKTEKDSPGHLHLVLLQLTALQKFLLFAMPSQASQHNRTKQ